MKPGAIREQDDQGHLTAAGYRWLAAENWRWVNLSVLLILLGILMFAACSVLWLGGVGAPLALGALLGLGLFVYGIRLNRRKRWIARAILFHSDGRVSAPEGLNGRKPFTFSSPQGDVRSIEAEKDRVGTTSRLVLYWGSGTTTVLAAELDSEVAHKVATQLNLALNELRAGISAHALRSASPAPQGARMID